MLTLSQQLNLLDLYDYEIRARISQHFSKIKPFEALIHDEEKELYAELYAVDTDKFSKHFWQCIRYSPLNSTLYDRVLEFLTDGILHDVFHCEFYCTWTFQLMLISMR